MKVAILYDFDKTLSIKDMQEFGFFKDLGYTSSQPFWDEVNTFSSVHHMDHILTYLYKMVEKAKEKGVPVTKTMLERYGQSIEFYPGVETWFDMMNAEATQRDFELEHYILSSGLTEIIEKTPIAHHFKKVYACSFLYDDKGHAIWPKLSVNYTMKTQFLYRINKGILDIENDEDLNKFQSIEDRPIPFTHMIYIGDGFTDVPSMKLVKANGGHAIAVSPYGKSKTQTTNQLLFDERVDFTAEADYRKGQRLHTLMCAIFDALKQSDKLKELEG